MFPVRVLPAHAEGEAEVEEDEADTELEGVEDEADTELEVILEDDSGGEGRQLAARTESKQRPARSREKILNDFILKSKRQTQTPP